VPHSDRAPIEIAAHRGTGEDFPQLDMLQSHRPSVPPENTLPAFEWGWARGTTCELDVYLTTDGEVIVIHDDGTKRTCNADLDVASSSLAELRALDAGIVKGETWRGLKLPLLREVLDVMPDGKRLYVELKQGPGLVDPVLAVVDAAGKGPDQIVFISFSIDSITAIKRRRPEFTCYWIIVFEEVAPRVWRCGYDKTGPDGLKFVTTWQQPIDYAALVAMARNDDVQLDALDTGFVMPDDFPSAMRELGMPWGVWNIDDADLVVRLANAGAIQFTSNCTDDVRDVVRKYTHRHVVV
jgi:glycerophosphoryl diester phosphodiesterase